MRRSAALALLIGAGLSAGGVAAASGDPASGRLAGVVRLSNETTLSRWAYPLDRGSVYARPSGKAHRVSVLHFLTEDGLPEDYLLLDQWKDPRGKVWVKIRLPQRPNELTGWVQRTHLGTFHRVTTLLVVNRHTLRMTLYRKGRVIFRAPVGVGKPSTPTPAGHFWVREHFRVPGHTLYGPAALGTSAHAPTLTDWPHGGVVGIHGTDQPSLVPGRPSHGCMRLHNADVRRLYRLVPIGTPLHII